MLVLLVLGRGGVCTVKLMSFVWQYMLIFLAGLLVLVILFYHFFIRVPDNQAAVYTAHVQTSATELEKAFNDVSAGTNRPLFNEPDLPIDTKIQQVAEINQQTANAQSKLASFRQDINAQLGLGFGAQRGTALNLKDRSKLVASQSQDVLADYSRAGIFLADYYSAQRDLLPYINLITLSNYRQAATKAHEHSVQIQSLTVPGDFKDVQNAAVDLYDDAAVTLQGIADGRVGLSGLLRLSIANNNLDLQLFALIGESSPTIQNARDLPDKLQSIGL